MRLAPLLALALALGAAPSAQETPGEENAAPEGYETYRDESGNLGMRRIDGDATESDRRDADVTPLVLPDLDLSTFEGEDVTGLVPDDTLAARTAPAATLARYRADPAFQYDRPEADRPSLWTLFLRWLKRTVWDPIFENTTAGFRDTVLLLLAALALGWAITRLLRADVGGLFGRRQRADDESVGPLLAVEDIAAVDLGALLARAEADGRWRDAVRFRYLLALQRLAAGGAIAWRIDKTNRDYLAEIRHADGRSGSAPVAPPFARATRVFDYVWYGERALDGATYARLGPTFDRLDDALAPGPRSSVPA